MLNKDEIKILLEKLDTQKLRELIGTDEIFIDSSMTKWEAEYAKLILGNRTYTEILVDEEMIRLANRLKTTKLLLVIEKISGNPENSVEFREPAYYLVTLT